MGGRRFPGEDPVEHAQRIMGVKGAVKKLKGKIESAVESKNQPLIPNKVGSDLIKFLNLPDPFPNDLAEFSGFVHNLSVTSKNDNTSSNK